MSDLPPRTDERPIVSAPRTEDEAVTRAGAVYVTEPRRRRILGLVAATLLLIVIAGIVLHGRQPTVALYVWLSMLLFTVGAFGVLIRRNAIVLFMCIELMLNAVNVAFAAFARMHQNVEGHVIVVFVMIVAAAEVAVGLAIIVSIFRRRHSANVDDLSTLRW